MEKISKFMEPEETFSERCQRMAKLARQNRPDISDIGKQVKEMKDKLLSVRPNKLIRSEFEPVREEMVFKWFSHKSKELGVEFQYSNSNKHVVLNAVRWLQGNRNMVSVNPLIKKVQGGDINKGLLITGEVGRGKTHILKTLSKVYEIDKPFFYTPANGKINEMKFGVLRAQDLTAMFSQEGYPVLQKYKTLPLLCIDDIGSESQTANYMGTRLNVIEDILTSRMDNGKLLTILTSNFDYDELKEFYGDRFHSRLHEHFNLLIIHGKDMRMN